MEEVISAVEQGYISYYEGKVQQPDIVSMEMPENNGETDIKSCYNKLNESISVKIASGFYDSGSSVWRWRASKNVDIAISTTPSKKYLVDKSLVKPGMHIVAVGADMAEKNEWDPEIFKGAKIVNDSIAQCISRGETRNAIISGIIKESDIYAEIGELLLGNKPLRESDDEITIFDTTGMGIQDNVTAAQVYEIAKKKGLGKYFEFI